MSDDWEVRELLREVIQRSREQTPDERLWAARLKHIHDLGDFRRGYDSAMGRDFYMHQKQQEELEAVPPLVFHRASDILDTIDDDLDFMIDGWWRAASFGVIGGSEKTLKSFMLQAMAWSVVSSDPLWGRLQVPRSGAALVFIGEGSKEDWLREVKRIAQAFGHNHAQIKAALENLHLTESVAPLTSPQFQRQYRHMLTEMAPLWTAVDPSYPYMGAVSGHAGDVYTTGPVLQACLSAPAIEARSALSVGHHSRKREAGTVMTLQDLTQSGFREWAASWVLAWHSTPPVLATGEFDLGLSVGGRGWSTIDYGLSINLGPWNPVTRRRDGVPSWTLTQPGLMDDEATKRHDEAMALRIREEHAAQAKRLHALLLSVPVTEAQPINNTTARGYVRKLLGISDRAEQNAVLTAGLAHELFGYRRGPGRAEWWWPLEPS